MTEEELDHDDDALELTVSEISLRMTQFSLEVARILIRTA